MKTFLRSLDALPGRDLGRHPDMLLAGMVVSVMAMLIVPMPELVLDVLLGVNISIAAMILLVTIFAEDALKVSTFPSLLLFTTLFRLALNVSTTRMILSRGSAGDVVESFGRFVLGGDLVVGLVLFLVITIVQFLVIAKGAERVAEVGARFTLDAMPGKQMQIEAAARSGALTEAEAEEQRNELARESKLFGAMDGAMKFVKGDAIAGLIITAINLVAGAAIGVMRRGLSLSEALDTYSTLSVGDGLVSQIPALFITLAAGVLTTRVAGKDKKDSLGQNLRAEIFSNPKVLGLGALVSLVIGLVPGMPTGTFLLISLVLLGMTGRELGRAKALAVETASKREAFKKKVEDKLKQAKSQRALADEVAPTVVPIQIDLDRKLSEALGFLDGEAAETELIQTLIPQLRDALYLETGVRFPGVRVQHSVRGLPAGGFRIRVKDVPVLEKAAPVGRLLAMEAPARLRRLGVTNARPTVHPLTEMEVALIEESDRQVVEAAGVAVWSAAGLIALELAGVLRGHAKAFVGLQEVGELVERLEKAFPTLVREVVPKVVTLQQLSDVLRRLVDEGVSIRDLKSVLEALAEHGASESDPIALTEAVRSALGLQISHAHAGAQGELPALLLDPAIEDAIAGAIHSTERGSYLALEPELCRAIVVSVAQALRPIAESGARPVILTHRGIRRYVRKLIEQDLRPVAVLSYEELPGELSVQPLGRAVIKDRLAA